MSSTEIVRTPNRATGGITAAEKIALDAHAAMWIGRILRTDPIEPDKIVPAIERLYAAAGLKKPRVVIVPSPFVAAFAGGFAAAIWYLRAHPDFIPDAATDAATRAAADAATRAATDAATRAATDAATRAATDAATYAATRAATDAAADAATYTATRAAADAATRAAADAADPRLVRFFLECAKRWADMYQGGNMWGSFDCYITGMRDIIGLRLPEHEKYEAWEQAAIHGGYRIMHPEFCLVSDFPEFTRMDDHNRPHCADGPSHRWRDGWSLYHVHGVRINDGSWIDNPEILTVDRVLGERNSEIRRVMVDRIGPDRFFAEARPEILDEDLDGQGMPRRLLRIDVQDDEPYVVVEVKCPSTDRVYYNPVPPAMRTCLQAVAWRFDLAPEDYLPLMEA